MKTLGKLYNQLSPQYPNLKVEILLYARYCANYLTWIDLGLPGEGYGESTQIAHGHTAGKWYRQNLNPSSLALESTLFTVLPG